MKKKKQKKAAVNKNMHVGLEAIKRSQIYSTEEDVPIDYSPLCTQELAEENFPEVALLATLGVRKCHCCKGEIIRKMQAPKDLVFHMQALQILRKVQPGTNVTAMFIFT